MMRTSKSVCILIRSDKKSVYIQLYKNYEDAKKAKEAMLRKNPKYRKQNIHVGWLPLMKPEDWERAVLHVTP